MGEVTYSFIDGTVITKRCVINVIIVKDVFNTFTKYPREVKHITIQWN